MPGQTIHLVAFNIPYPPDYGGVIDIYYKVKALHDAGVQVILHCFRYGREMSPELEQITAKTYYYPRHAGIRYFLSGKPYIVHTRQSESLEHHLLNDAHPVLFEGLHTTGLLQKCNKAGKQTLVRTHNIEHRYYRMIGKSTSNPVKKIFLLSEAGKLKRYEPVLEYADHLLSISTTDAAYFKSEFGSSQFIPAFHSHEQVSSLTGTGAYILFHGNLSVPENERAVQYLVNRVLSKINYPTIIAGKKPGRALQKLCSNHAHIDLIASPDSATMDKLVRDAHINLLYTYQPTGLKLKLLHSLFAGRYCMANPLMLSGSGLDEVCEVYNKPSQAIEMIDRLMQTPFPETKVNARIAALSGFDNRVNAARIMALING